MDRIILHVDVNNAFLSWTAVWLLKQGKSVDIRRRYAVIGGDESKRRGIVLAKSDLCKSRGVITSESLYSARRKCPYLEVYPCNFSVYRDYSDKMYNYLCRYTNIIERYSIDECFLDYTGSYKLFGDPVRVAYKIKNDIKRMFGFTVNVGVGNNKLEAKMASDFTKPDRVHTLFDNEVMVKMWPLEIENLFMIGRSTSKRLRDMGINTIGDLAGYDEDKIIFKFKKYGKMMWEYANGIDNSLVSYEKVDAKSISSSMTLPYNYGFREDIYEVLRKESRIVGVKLRGSKMYAGGVGIWIKYADFEKVSKQVKLNVSIDTDSEIFEQARILFDKLWDSERRVRGICVSVRDVSSLHNKQLSLFDVEKDRGKGEDDERLQRVIDDIRVRYGADKIGYANEKK